jgi:hypothetical protein
VRPTGRRHRRDAAHRARERGEVERLVAVGERGGRLGVHLDEQAVGARGHRRERERRDERRAAAGVARVDQHRQVRLGAEHRHRGHVERVARRRLEGADAALAEDHALVALHAHVLEASSSSRTVADSPRLSSTGTPARPTSASSA